MTTRHWVVRGRVQGVNFRAATRDRARTLGLECQVWNRDDGGVECVAEGDESRLEQLERFLHRGPSLAEVESVERVSG
ncbi:MAG TPA: acylphosphatase [Candidatus Limnocylindria bacterium]|nr:acylphosphatase [Candidatus Limnocylindria bacterium]